MTRSASKKSERAKKAWRKKIRAAIARRLRAGLSWGNAQGKNLGPAIAAASESRRSRAMAWAMGIYPKVAELIAAGESMRSVARIMNEREIPSRRGGLWTVATVRRILAYAAQA